MMGLGPGSRFERPPGSLTRADAGHSATQPKQMRDCDGSATNAPETKP
jgi:hypothetical protein